MANFLYIKSGIQDYSVSFVDDFQESLREDLKKPYVIIIDQNVSNLYSSILDPLLKNNHVLKVKAIETNKTLAFVQNIIEFLTENNFKRNHTLIAIGGGIIQDLTCFTASILFRGVSWIFYPTTLLAQCDSCIGSKSSINVGTIKNQVGTFYPPQKIVIDTKFTSTLEPIDIFSGLGEAIKVHYLDEEQRFESIFNNYPQVLEDLQVLEQVIYDSLMIKKRVIEIDEYDQEYRNIMNYGHTLGHALESVTKYQIPHGIAVTIGMGIANTISQQLGYLSKDDMEKMETLIQANSKLVSIKLDSLEPLWEALKKDKKNTDDEINFILTHGFGKMFKAKLPLDEKIKSITVDYLTQKNML